VLLGGVSIPNIPLFVQRLREMAGRRRLRTEAVDRG